jgi:lysophospholipase L1-like esterase
MLLGSSVTERSFSLEHYGWGAALSNWYARSADVLNRGAGGYNSRWLRKLLPDLLGSERPDMTILFIGNNDAIQEGESQHVPLTEYKDNIISILEQLNAVNSAMAVLLVTTTRVNEHVKPFQKDARRFAYAEVLRHIHRHRAHPEVLNATRGIPQRIALVDLWGGAPCNDVQQAEKLDRYSITASDLHDGVHMNSSGNKKIFAAIRDAINMQFPHLSPDNARPPAGSPRVKRSCSMDVSAAYQISSYSSSSSSSNNANKCGASHRGIDHSSSSADSSSSGGADNGASNSVLHNSKRQCRVSVTASTCAGTLTIALSPEQPAATTNRQTSVHAAAADSSSRTYTECSASEDADTSAHLLQDANQQPPLRWTVPRWRTLV